MVREEADASLRRYCPLGPGNYNPSTARLYEDFGLLTADPTVAEDATDLFNHLTGYARQDSYPQPLGAPEALRAGVAARGADCSVGGGHLPDQARRARAVRDDPGPQRAGPVPGTLPGLRVRHRRERERPGGPRPGVAGGGRTYPRD